MEADREEFEDVPESNPDDLEVRINGEPVSEDPLAAEEVSDDVSAEAAGPAESGTHESGFDAASSEVDGTDGLSPVESDGRRMRRERTRQQG